MNQTTTPSAFVERFDVVRARMLRVQISSALCRALFIFIAGLAALALLDYLGELPRSARIAGVAGLSLTTAGIAVSGIWCVLRDWNRPRTAAQIEEHFPELGQSVRTTVQYSGLGSQAVAAAGVRTTLVSALEQEIDVHTTGLSLESIVPIRTLRIAVGAVGAVALLLSGAWFVDPQWHTAINRALLNETPYTQLSVAPGDTQIEEGRDAAISIELAGRTRRRVSLWTRPADATSSEWQELELAAEEATTTREGKLIYGVTLSKLKEPLDYRVTAGSITSESYRIVIRYPLRLREVEVELAPPEYTGLPPETVADGNFAALEGTHARFRFELDRSPVEAYVTLVSPGDVRDSADDLDAPQSQIVPASIDGSFVAMALDVTAERVYTLSATAADGMTLPEKHFRIRIRKDQPPQVSFDEPREALEVHTLAEVPMKIRVRDDFGLTKAGIVFQINNEEENVLLLEDFVALAEAATAAAQGRSTPATQAVLERFLPLEHFELTQKDSVAYYAFAEDNFPGGARRTETDLRFIDIRPFRRLYRLLDLPDGTPMGGKPLASLEELIARQRFALNRVMQVARRRSSAGQPELTAIDQMIEFEGKLATSTRELAEFLEAREVAGNDLLFQAETEMLAAVDSLSAGKYDIASLQEKDALRYLVEARNSINQGLLKKPPKELAAIRAFDRMQAQKLRKPKSDAEAAEVAARLRELAEQEDFVYETLAGLMIDDVPPTDGMKGSGGKGQPPKDPQKPMPEGESGTKPEDPASTSEIAKNESSETGRDTDPPKEPSLAGQTGDQLSSSGKSAAEARDEAVQKQADIVAEAQEVEKALQKLEGITDLAKSRIAEALKNAEQVAGELDRGDNGQAQERAGDTAGMFRELARHVEALAAKEASEKIALARSLSDELSDAERQFSDEIERQQQQAGAGDSQKSPADDPGRNPGKSPMGQSPKGQSGQGDSSEGTEPGDGSGKGAAERRLARQADRLAEAGKTLEDILKSVARSNDPADKEAIRQVQEVITQNKVSEIVERIGKQSGAIEAGKNQDVTGEARDIADRLEATARRLDGVHRNLVAPRVAELLVLEQKAVDLQEKLEDLKTEMEITQWHRAAEALLRDLEQADISEDARTQLREAMQAAGWTADRSVDRRWGWDHDVDHYGAPVVYRGATRTITEYLHALVQELLLGDLAAAGDEAAPPQYERLIERYYQILSSDRRQK